MNVSATFIRGKPVYSPITYKDLKSYIIVVLAFFFGIGAYYLGYLFFEQIKKPRMLKKERE